MLTIDTALDECRECRTLLGEFVSYNEKAGRIIAASLGLRRLLDARPELIDGVRDEACRDLKRKLNRKKIDHICLYMCVETSTEEERKKCSKFVPVVAAAHAEGVEPGDAATWLKTFRAFKAASRRAKSSRPKHFPIRFETGAFPRLAASTDKGRGWPRNKRVSEELAAAAQRCEQLLREMDLPADPSGAASTA